MIQSLPSRCRPRQRHDLALRARRRTTPVAARPALSDVHGGAAPQRPQPDGVPVPLPTSDAPELPERAHPGPAEGESEGVLFVAIDEFLIF